MDSSSINSALVSAIGWTFLFGSIYSIILLGIYSRKYPVQRENLTQRIVQRSWNGLQVGGLLAAFTGLMTLLPLIYVLAGGARTALAQLLIVVVFSLAQLTLLIAFARIRKRSWAADFGMGRRQLRILPLSITIYLAVIPFLSLLSWLYNLMLEQVFGLEVNMQEAAELIAESRSWIKAGLILVSILAAPLYEEIVFRGVFFPYLMRRMGFWPAMLAVSAAFAAVHFHLPSMLPLFLLSLVLCRSYWRTGSLWVSIGLHALFNGVSVTILLLAQ